jgi:hypothetical protein
MNYSQLLNAQVEFKDEIADQEAYPEGGMRATIVSITPDKWNKPGHTDHEQVWMITFDYSKFDEYNKGFESSNYYNSNGDAVATARETGFYEVREQIYFPGPSWNGATIWNNFFTIADTDRIKLVMEYSESGVADKGVSYSTWLEDKVLNAK